MAHEPRSHYELGDPIRDVLAREARTEHYRAAARGRRILGLADSVVAVLHAAGLLTDPEAGRRETFHVLADALYPNSPIDVPDFTNARSLEAMRRGATKEQTE